MPQALLIIDVQQQLCEGPEAAFDHAAVIERINVASRKARAAGAPVIFIQHSGKNGYLSHGSPGWQLAAGLASFDGDLFVDKTTPDSFHNTGLQDLLNQHQIGELVIVACTASFVSTRRLAARWPSLSGSTDRRCAYQRRKCRTERRTSHCAPQCHAQQHQQFRPPNHAGQQ